MLIRHTGNSQKKKDTKSKVMFSGELLMIN